MTARIVGDLSTTPTTGFRQHGLWFWAGCGFMLIEGTGFALAAAAYIMLMTANTQWPLTGVAPDLLWGTLATAVFVASLIPNELASRAARKRDLPATRLWVAAMAAITAVLLVLRGFEFAHLNTRWEQDAYGSITWALILLHTTHLITDFADTLFLAVFLVTHPVDNERFSDADDNAGYWAFIVLWQVAYYALIYWAPRWAP